MGALKVKLLLDEPDQCSRCGGDNWNVYSALCDPCFDEVYAEFKRVMGWPS